MFIFISSELRFYLLKYYNICKELLSSNIIQVDLIDYHLQVLHLCSQMKSNILLGEIFHVLVSE